VTRLERPRDGSEHDVHRQLDAGATRTESSPPADDGDDWADVVGPCFTAESLADLLGVTAMEVSDAAEHLNLLSFVTRDGVLVLPEFQFRESTPPAGLRDVLSTLRMAADAPLMWAQWLTGLEPDRPRYLRPRRRIDALHDGDLEAVLFSAQHTAAAWSCQPETIERILHRRPALGGQGDA